MNQTMTFSRLRQFCLWSIIGFLSLSALLAIVSLLSGHFGSIQLKVILTTLTIAGASICGMACSAFIEKRGWARLGGVGIACTLVAAMLSISGIWSDYGAEIYWKITVSLIVISVAFAHALLLFIPSLASSYRWSQIGAAIFISILAAQIILAVYSDVFQNAEYFRLIGIVAVVVVLLTLIVPNCSKLGAIKPKEADTLTLSHDTDDIYHDATGQRYKVTKL